MEQNVKFWSPYGVYSFFLIVMKKQALFWKFGADSCRWSWEKEQNVKFWSPYRVIPSFWLSWKKKLCSESLEQIHSDGVKKQKENMFPYFITLHCVLSVHS